MPFQCHSVADKTTKSFDIASQTRLELILCKSSYFTIIMNNSRYVSDQDIDRTSDNSPMASYITHNIPTLRSTIQCIKITVGNGKMSNGQAFQTYSILLLNSSYEVVLLIDLLC